MADSESDRITVNPTPSGDALTPDPIDLRSPSEPEFTETEILQMLFESPDNGWSVFWETYSGTIVQKVRRFGLPPEDVSDLVQEVSLKIIQENCRLLRLWDSERGCLRGYLSVITHSVVLDFLRSPFHRYAAVRAPKEETNGRPHKQDPLEIAGGGPNPRAWAEKREILKEITACLDKMAEDFELKPRDRVLLRMRLAGMRFREIAEILGTTESNASTRFSRLLPLLRRSLKGRRIEWIDLSEP